MSLVASLAVRLTFSKVSALKIEDSSVQKLNSGSMCARQVRQLYRLPCKIALAVFWPITINHKGSVCQKYIWQKKRIANIWSASSFLDLFFAQLHRSSIGKAIKLKIERVTKKSGNKLVQFIAICSIFLLPISTFWAQAL